jgi:sterol desaturase/sphingolipid hydroxylase (fatty acid hydroxylase superfamily)
VATRPFLLFLAVPDQRARLERARLSLGRIPPRRTRLLCRVFPKAIWRHRSALADYRYRYVNEVLFALRFGAYVLSTAWVARSVRAALDGAVLGVFMHLHGADTGVVTILGIHVFVFIYNAIGNLRHSHVWLSYSPRLSYLFLSPAQHQFHHSTRPAHFGCNIGYSFALWDWLFGTIYVPAKEERFAMGLGDGSDAKYHGVVRMYVQPFIDIGRYLATGRASSGAAIGAPTPRP